MQRKFIIFIVLLHEQRAFACLLIVLLQGQMGRLEFVKIVSDLSLRNWDAVEKFAFAALLVNGDVCLIRIALLDAVVMRIIVGNVSALLHVGQG